MKRNAGHRPRKTLSPLLALKWNRYLHGDRNPGTDTHRAETQTQKREMDRPRRKTAGGSDRGTVTVPGPRVHHYFYFLLALFRFSLHFPVNVTRLMF